MNDFVAMFLDDPVAALSDWDLAIDGWHRLDGGNANTSVVLQCGGRRLVATLCQEKSEPEVRALAAVYRHLERHHHRSARLVTTAVGAPLGLVGGVPLMVKTWAEGVVVMRPTDAQLSAVGGALARLHRVPICDALPVDHLFGLRRADVVIGSGIDQDFGRYVATRLAALRPVIFGLADRGLIHGDVFMDNVVFDEDQPTLLDFEEAATGPFGLDIGMAVVGTCVRDGALDGDAVAALVAGYDRVRPRTAAERSTLAACAELAALACGLWRCWSYNIARPTPAKANAHRQMMVLAEQARRMGQALAL